MKIRKIALCILLCIALAVTFIPTLSFATDVNKGQEKSTETTIEDSGINGIPEDVVGLSGEDIKACTNDDDYDNEHWHLKDNGNGDYDLSKTSSITLSASIDAGKGFLDKHANDFGYSWYRWNAEAWDGSGDYERIEYESDSSLVVTEPGIYLVEANYASSTGFEYEGMRFEVYNSNYPLFITVNGASLNVQEAASGEECRFPVKNGVVTVSGKLDGNDNCCNYEYRRIYVTAKPDAGYLLKSLSAVTTGNQQKQVDLYKGYFYDNFYYYTMPGDNVNLQVEFEPDSNAAVGKKKTNTMIVKTSKKTLKVKALKKKAKTIAPITVTKAKGAVSYKVTSGNAKSKKVLKLNSKTGKITVQKKTKKGTYTIKVKVTAKGTKTYKAGSKTVTVTVKVN